MRRCVVASLRSAVALAAVPAALDVDVAVTEARGITA
jgi:hypothetical protein